MGRKIISAALGIMFFFNLHTTAWAYTYSMAQPDEVYTANEAGRELSQPENTDNSYDKPSSDSDGAENCVRNTETNEQETSRDCIPASEETVDIIREPATWEESSGIVTSLPEIDALNPEYITFKNDVLTIIEKARKYSGVKTPVGVFVMDLKTNFHTGVNDTRTRIDPNDGMIEGYFNSASVIKLFQGYILYDMIRRGELDGEVVYTDPVTGWSFKIPDMIHTMISLSDNNLSNVALRLVGNVKSNEVLARLGIKDSVIYGEMSGAIGYSLKNNIEKYGTSKRCARITPRDTGLILYNIYINKDRDAYMAALNRALLANIYNTRIPVGVNSVNKSYAIAHKTGTNSSLGIYNDAGIIYAKRPFILVAFTQGTTSQAAHSFIRKLAKDLTTYFDSL